MTWNGRWHDKVLGYISSVHFENGCWSDRSGDGSESWAGTYFYFKKKVLQQGGAVDRWKSFKSQAVLGNSLLSITFRGESWAVAVCWIAGIIVATKYSLLYRKNRPHSVFVGLRHSESVTETDGSFSPVLYISLHFFLFEKRNVHN